MARASPRSQDRCLLMKPGILSMSRLATGKIAFKAASGLMVRPVFKLYFLMYTQTFFVTSVRAIFLSPQIFANASLSVFGAKSPTPFFFMAAVQGKEFDWKKHTDEMAAKTKTLEDEATALTAAHDERAKELAECKTNQKVAAQGIKDAEATQKMGAATLAKLEKAKEAAELEVTKAAEVYADFEFLFNQTAVVEEPVFEPEAEATTEEQPAATEEVTEEQPAATEEITATEEQPAPM